MFITVRADGSVVNFDPPRSVITVPATGSFHSKGKYDVGFARAVTNCAATATTTEGWVGVVGVAMGVPSEHWVTIYTMDPASKQLVDLPFHLIVVCPK